MGIIIDLIIVAIFALFIMMGCKKGLTGSLIKLLSFAIALILATINLFIGNTILRVVIYTSNTIIITENIIHAIGISKNEKALKARITYERKKDVKNNDENVYYN